MRRFLAFLLICLLFVTPAAADSTSKYNDQADLLHVEELLQGTWERRGKITGSDIISCEKFEFYDGILYYKSFLEGYENSIHDSWGTYLITEDSIDSFYNDYTSHLKYEIEGNSLAISWYVESGADKGTTHHYTQTSKLTPDIPSSTDSEEQCGIANIEEMLMGTWEHYERSEGSARGFHRVYEFSNGTACFRWFSEGQEDAGGMKLGTYRITDDTIEITYEDYTSHLDYKIKEGTLSISWYANSGSNKGTTYLFTHTSTLTPDIPSSISSEDKDSVDHAEETPTDSHNDPPSEGAWTLYDEFALRSCKKLIEMGIRADSYSIDKVYVLRYEEGGGSVFTFIEGSNPVSDENTIDIFVYNDFFLQRDANFEPNYVGEETALRKTLYGNLTEDNIRLHFFELQADYVYYSYSNDISKDGVSSSDIYKVIPINDVEILEALSSKQSSKAESATIHFANISFIPPDGPQSVEDNASNISFTIEDGTAAVVIAFVDMSENTASQMRTLMPQLQQGVFIKATKGDTAVNSESVWYTVLDKPVEFAEYVASGTHWSIGTFYNGDYLYTIAYGSINYSKSAAEVYKTFLGSIENGSNR